MGLSVDEHLYLLCQQQWDDPKLQGLKIGNGGSARQIVPGDGSLRPKAILVGTAPGVMEDQAGSPIAGPHGAFLNELLKIAGLSDEQVWVTNVMKLRAPQDRDPEPGEIAASLRYLRSEVSLLARNGCKVLIGLGGVGSSVLAGEPISVGREHGTWRTIRNKNEERRLFVSYHPAWGVRRTRNRQIMIADFQQLGHSLGMIPEGGSDDP